MAFKMMKTSAGQEKGGKAKAAPKIRYRGSETHFFLSPFFTVNFLLDG
jgi:hypothetical protein